MKNNIWDLSKPRRLANQDTAILQIQIYAKSLNDGAFVTKDGYNNWKHRIKYYSSCSIERIFDGSFSKACIAAGVNIKKKHIYSFDELFEHIENVAKWRNQIPSIGDLKKYNEKHNTSLTYDAYARRWGSWKNFLKVFVQFKNNQISKQELINASKKSLRRKAISKRSRAEVLARDNYKCSDCGRTVDDGCKLHVHHKIPASHGGQNNLENLITNCADCNMGKSNVILN